MDSAPSGSDPISVVGIGASAGGLAALRILVGQLPERIGLAYVIVVHLAPDHESHLADLLQPQSTMPVQQVTDATLLEADHVYVIPPNRHLSAIDTHLRLTELDGTSGRRHPIDHFFRTLADVHDGRSIGVVLSGTGTDGTIGLSMIRAHGGLTIAQDPDEAEYDGMPRSAIVAESVDLVLPVADMGERIARFGASPPDQLSDIDGSSEPPSALQEILSEIRRRCGRDLSGYKPSTILRRMRRRVQLHGRSGLDDYLELVKESPDEVELLLDDLLIPVTNFFRDTDVFDELAAEVIPGLFEGKGQSDTVRVWSAGCSTGEEAYSLAMLLLEHADTLSERPQIQVFATDLHEASLQRARQGFYPAAIEADVSPDRLRRHFIYREGGYGIGQDVRDVVVFAHHDLLSDPPFSRLDLLSCRNLLIYLQREVQRDVTSIFHYALNPSGVLLLGTSETVQRSDMFTTIDKHQGLFRRRGATVSEPRLPQFRPGSARGAPAAHRRPLPPEVGYDELHRSLLEKHGPPSLLLDGNNRVVRFSSDVGRYLTHPAGVPTSEVFQLIDEQLRFEMRSAIYDARRQQRASVSRTVGVRIDGDDRTISFTVVPVADDDLLLVIFNDVDVRPVAELASEGAMSEVDTAEELENANRRLESVIEQYEAGQEEMKASNEELQSANEELRSTMEELETSKEELQSSNEELSTLNQENRHKVEELAMLSSDLQNLLTATDIATLFLDRQLRIVRFTPSTARIFNIVEGDRGRPLTDFTSRLQANRLHDDAQMVLDDLVPIEHELLSDDGRWLLTRVLPYRTWDDRIEGVVITFVDITRRYEAESALRSSEHGLRLALDAAAMGTWWWDAATGESDGDPRAYEIAGASPDDGDFVDAAAQKMSESDRRRWIDFVRSGTVRDLELRITGSDRDSVVQLNVRDQASDEFADSRSGGVRRGTIRDVTEQVRARTSLAERSERLSLLADSAAHLLRGSKPETLLTELFDDMSDMLGFEIHERFDFDGDGTPRVTSGNAEWSTTGATEATSGACSRAFEQREPIVYRDDDSSENRVPSAIRDDGVTTYGCFPLVAGDDVLGALAFGTRGPERFDQERLDLIRTIVDYLAAAEQRLRNEAELRSVNRTLEERVTDATRELRESGEQLRNLASNLVRAEQGERQRIAQLLHDDVQQLLFGAQMRLGLLRDDLDTRGIELADHLDEAERYLNESIEVTRHLSVELSPPVLDDEDLAEMIGWLVEQMREVHGLDVDVEQDAELSVPDRETRVLIHQTMRELLFNVVKHAGVDRATIEVRLSDDEFEIHVSDHGVGFDTTQVFADPVSNGRGLATLRQRLGLVGGGLDLESIPGDGTVAHVRLPHTTGSESFAP